jgi:hypothetical protein
MMAAHTGRKGVDPFIVGSVLIEVPEMVVRVNDRAIVRHREKGESIRMTHPPQAVVGCDS